MIKTIVFLIAFVLLSYNAWAASVTAAAVFEVENLLPLIKLEMYDGEDFSNPRSSFSNGEEGYLRIEITDGNGYRDIDNVTVRFLGLRNNESIVINDYSNATFLSGGGNTAVYYYSFDVGQEYNDYRLDVKIADGEEEIVSSIDFNTVSNVGVTGAAVAQPTRQAIREFFRNLITRLLNIF